MDGYATSERFRCSPLHMPSNIFGVSPCTYSRVTVTQTGFFTTATRCHPGASNSTKPIRYCSSECGYHNYGTNVTQQILIDGPKQPGVHGSGGENKRKPVVIAVGACVAVARYWVLKRMGSGQCCGQCRASFCLFAHRVNQKWVREK